MTMRNAFSDLATEAGQMSIEELQTTTVVLLAAILEKMPRVTGNDQAAVSIESGSVGIAANSNLATLATLTNMQQVGTKFTSGDNLNLAGVQHLYNNIIVS